MVNVREGFFWSYKKTTMTMVTEDNEGNDKYMLFIRYCQSGDHPDLASPKLKSKTPSYTGQQKRITDYFKKQG